MCHCHIFSSYFNILTIFLRFHQTTDQRDILLKINVIQQKNNRRSIFLKNDIEHVACTLFWVNFVLPTCHFFICVAKFQLANLLTAGSTSQLEEKRSHFCASFKSLSMVWKVWLSGLGTFLSISIFRFKSSCELGIFSAQEILQYECLDNIFIWKELL